MHARVHEYVGETDAQFSKTQKARFMYRRPTSHDTGKEFLVPKGFTVETLDMGFGIFDQYLSEEETGLKFKMHRDDTGLWTCLY